MAFSAGNDTRDGWEAEVDITIEYCVV